MPQFDFYSFSTQNFWVLAAFIFLYIFFLYFYLNNFSEVYKMRYKLITFFHKSTNDSLRLFLYFL